jgi:hypothetical protein
LDDFGKMFGPKNLEQPWKIWVLTESHQHSWEELLVWWQLAFPKVNNVTVQATNYTLDSWIEIARFQQLVAL